MAEQGESKELPSSRLGTQEYWEQAYRREVSNFASDGDRGEVWFGQEAAQLMLEYLRSRHSSSSFPGPTILDVGTGNGHLLFSLCGVPDDDDDDEYESDEEEEKRKTITSPERMCGVDYSPASIQLCKDITADVITKGVALSNVGKIEWRECDVLDQTDVQELSKRAASIRGEDDKGPGGWDIVLDKGTLDAIALTPTTSTTSSTPTPLNKYILALASLTRPGGLFLVTSCNFTSEELIARIASTEPQASASASFQHLETLPPKKQFTFGGRKGSTTVCVAFKRR